MFTEVTLIKLSEPMKLNDSFFAPRGAFMQTLAVVSKQEYFQRGFWGIEDEDPSNLRMFVNWTDTTTNGQNAGKLLQHELAACDHVVYVEAFRVKFEPALPHEPLDPNTSFSTMVETIYFDRNFEHADGWERNFKKKVRNIINERGDVFKAAAGGWVEELVVNRQTQEKCKLWFAIVGWPTMGHHLEWRDSPSHAENQKLLEEYKSAWRGLVRVHSSMNLFPHVGQD